MTHALEGSRPPSGRVVSIRVTFALEIHGLTKRYVAGAGGCLCSVQVLRAVDLSLRPGDSLAVVGPAASGKSTLLLAAAGLVAPDSGTISWYGDPARSAAFARAMYHFAAARHRPPRVPRGARVHLIDDPDALDPPTLGRLGAWIHRRCARGDAIVVGTRSMIVARSLAPAVMRLDGGQLVAEGSGISRVAEPSVARGRIRACACASTAECRECGD